MTGPLALPQPHEHGTRLPFTECLAVTRREQELTVIPFGPLDLAIADEHLAHLVGQRQVMLDAGLGVFGRNEPLTLSQTDVRPACLPGFADAGAMAEHHQSQQAVRRVVRHCAEQATHQVLELGTTQSRRLDPDLGFGEVVELDARHWVGRNQAQLERLTESQG
ncbi:hypothetical protein D3C75_644480 [compost metagenome]